MMTELALRRQTDHRALSFALFVALFIVWQRESWTTVMIYMGFEYSRANISYLMIRPTVKAVR